MPGSIFTIGHSTRPLEAFLDPLKAYAITLLADVRTIPRSRHNPQFNRDTLSRDLGVAGISYVHMAGLGGLRHPRPDSPNTGWRNASFRGFADYMQSREFSESLEALIEMSRQQTVAIMCAEAVPWRCHRMLIADSLVIRGIETTHILDIHHCQSHALTPMAKATGTHIIYSNDDAALQS